MPQLPTRQESTNPSQKTGRRSGHHGLPQRIRSFP
jgi:hypothetical protein